MIKTINLSKVYQTDEVETISLDKINLTVREGEFLAVMGPSGCGKSTLLNILGLIDNPSSGEFYFLDEEVSNYNEKQRAELRKNNIGFIFQSFNLIDELTVRENIELPLLYQKMATSQRKQMADEVMEKLQIAHRAKHFPQQLSGGQQQRVAVARAVVTKPKLILADEPTGNLDSKNGDEVMDIIKSLNATGTTVIMVTHSPEHAQQAERIVNLFDGKLLIEQERAVV
ncbi:MAG: ABC transporter ATP-binding protein [bacterium]